MTIKEVEERTGIARSSIRFYEKEKLIQPIRNNDNGYRDYTEENIKDIKKIAYLRTLGISHENIRGIINQKVTLREIIDRQVQVLEGQIVDLEKFKYLCQKMLSEEKMDYELLDVEAYVPDITEYWESNQKIFKMDSVSFLYLWGGSLAWGIITGLCFIVALLMYPHLPVKIPIQWSNGEISSEVGKIFIFAYPAACIVIRFFLRPFIWRWLNINTAYSYVISDYLSNYVCFIALSTQMFTVCFIYGIAKHITTVLWLDTIVLIGILLIGWYKLEKC